MPLLHCILLLLSVLYTTTAPEPRRMIETETSADSSLAANCTLPTGWYHISTQGCRHRLGNTDDYYMVNPVPIVLDTNITTMQLQEYVDDNGENRQVLVMFLDAAGTEAWRIATRESIKERFGFMYNNRLIHASTVQSEITGGVAALNGQHSRAELDNVRKSIEAVQAVLRPDGYWITADIPWETAIASGDTMATYGSARILHFAAGGVCSMLSGMPYLSGDSIERGEPGYTVYSGRWAAWGDTVIASYRFGFHTQGLVKEAEPVRDTMIVQRNSAGVVVLAGAEQRYGAAVLTHSAREFYARLIRTERAAR